MGLDEGTEECVEVAGRPPLPHSLPLAAGLLCAAAWALARAFATGTAAVPAGLPGGRLALAAALPLASLLWPAGALAAGHMLGQPLLELGPVAALALLAVVALPAAGHREAGDPGRRAGRPPLRPPSPSRRTR